MDKLDAKRIIAAVSLDTVDGSGRTLATVATEAGSRAFGRSSHGVAQPTLGSGQFGKVGTYLYHGATVAVKELKEGADGESIGAFPIFSLLGWTP